jgi:hypothetical protein
LGIDHERTRRFGVCRNESDANKWHRYEIKWTY